MKSLFILTEAKQELKSAISFYQEKDEILGVDLTDALENGFRNIQTHPNRWMNIDENNRKKSNKSKNHFLLSKFEELWECLYSADQSLKMMIERCH